MEITEPIEETLVIPLLQKEDQYLGTVQSDEKHPVSCTRIVKKDLVHFYFCLEGSATFEFTAHYSRELTGGRNYFIYDPTRDFSFQLHLTHKCRLVLLAVSLDELRELFIDDSSELTFFNNIDTQHKFYDEKEIPASLMLVLSQLFSKQLSESAQRVFYQGKVLEILSEYFSSRKPNTESCPFLADEAIVRKLKYARDFILENVQHPPSLKSISRKAGLNEHQLKVGFKELFGSTVHNYSVFYRLDQARLMLDTGNFQVKEVSYQVGYANTSHFIASFKKKFGITPKQYLKQRD